MAEIGRSVGIDIGRDGRSDSSSEIGICVGSIDNGSDGNKDSSSDSGIWVGRPPGMETGSVGKRESTFVGNRVKMSDSGKLGSSVSTLEGIKQRRP